MEKITEENKWEACIALWEKMACIPQYKIRTLFINHRSIHDMKNEILLSLGYDRCMFGCPMCAVHCNYEHGHHLGHECEECPIANNHGFISACEMRTSPYRIFRNSRLQEDANRFLVYLRELRERDEMGLLPTNRNLKQLSLQEDDDDE